MDDCGRFKFYEKQNISLSIIHFLYKIFMNLYFINIIKMLTKNVNEHLSCIVSSSLFPVTLKKPKTLHLISCTSTGNVNSRHCPLSDYDTIAICAYVHIIYLTKDELNSSFMILVV